MYYGHFAKGHYAISIAGHDAGSVYVILDSDADFVYLSDGRLKPINRPKKKKRGHLHYVNKKAEAVMTKLDAGLPVTNEDIKQSIKAYSKNQTNN